MKNNSRLKVFMKERTLTYSLHQILTHYLDNASQAAHMLNTEGFNRFTGFKQEESDEQACTFLLISSPRKFKSLHVLPIFKINKPFPTILISKFIILKRIFY